MNDVDRIILSTIKDRYENRTRPVYDHFSRRLLYEEVTHVDIKDYKFLLELIERLDKNESRPPD